MDIKTYLSVAPHSKHHGAFVAATMIVIAIACIAIVLLAPGGTGGPPQSANSLQAGGNSRPLPVLAATPVYASSGEIVKGFPASMILDAGAKISNSYSLSYNSSLSQYTATFSSGMDMEALFSGYLAYFGKNGWNVTNQVTRYPTSRGIYAAKGNNEASVAIISQLVGSKVIASFLTK